MKTKNDFAAFVEENEAAQKHALEIQQTRIGGFGGSDAALLLKIGESGLSPLTATDHKRIAIMLGKCEPNSWSGNAYTHAGHAFEDYAEKVIPFGTDSYTREAYMSTPIAINFKTFAHADFLSLGTVVECKFVQDNTANVVKKYYAQLQWYYLMGATSVVLYHGTGCAEPFEVQECNILQIERDEKTIELLLAGISILDHAIADGWKPEVQDKITYENTPLQIQRAFDRWSKIKVEKAKLELDETEVKNIIKGYIEDWGLTGIVLNGEVKQQVIYTREKTNYVFNSDEFLKNHPEFNIPENFKSKKTSASVTFK